MKRMNNDIAMFLMTRWVPFCFVKKERAASLHEKILKRIGYIMLRYVVTKRASSVICITPFDIF
jgi:hypothetical protein